MSIPESNFTVNGKTVGHGKEGYEQVLKAIIDLRSGAFVIFRMPIAVRAAYDQEYASDDPLPFGTDREAYDLFNKIATLQDLHWGSAELKTTR